MKAREEKGVAGGNAGGTKRTGGEIPAGKSKKQKIADTFFKHHKINQEDKSTFLDTMVKLLDWQEKGQ